MAHLYSICMIELSLVIPVYNAAPFLSDTLRRLGETLMRHADWELIVIDDGSCDETRLILKEELPRLPRARALHFDCNRGKGAALLEGFRTAGGQCVVFTDADLPYGLSILGAMYRHMEEHPEIALLYGSRHHALSREASGYGSARRLGRLFFSVVIRAFLRDVVDSQCGIKAFRHSLAKRCVERGRIDRFAADIEFFAIARAAGLRYADFPVELNHRKQSSIRLIRDTVRMLVDIMRIAGYYWSGAYR